MLSRKYIVLLSSVVFAGCYAAYMPNPTLSPHLTKEGDNSLCASVAATSLMNLQGAYALSDRYAIYYGLDGNLGSISDSTWHNNILAEAAWLYYWLKGSSAFDIMLGAGYGSTFFHENGLFTHDFGGGRYKSIQETSFRYVRPFVQFDFGGDIAESQRIAIGLRGAYVHGLYFHDSLASFNNSDSTYDVTTRSSLPRFFSLEWTITWKGRVYGTKGLYLITQFELPLLGPRRLYGAAVYAIPNASAGLELNF